MIVPIPACSRSSSASRPVTCACRMGSAWPAWWAIAVRSANASILRSSRRSRRSASTVVGGEVVGQPHAPSVGVGETAGEPDPARLQRRQVHLAPARAARQLQGRLPPGSGGARVLLEPAGEDAHGIEPPADVQPPVRPRYARVRPDGKGDPEAASSSASCTPVAEAPTTRTPPPGRGPGGAVGRGGQLDDPGVEPGRQAGDVREVTPAGGEDDRRGCPGSGGRHDAVAAAGPPDRRTESTSALSVTGAADSAA